MKIGRLALAVVGLVALAVAYFTGSLVFLVVAIVAFIAGLYVMGAHKRPINESDKEKRDQGKKGSKS